jgi:hypothetical protein
VQQQKAQVAAREEQKRRDAVYRARQKALVKEANTCKPRIDVSSSKKIV